MDNKAYSSSNYYVSESALTESFKTNANITSVNKTKVQTHQNKLSSLADKEIFNEIYY